MVDGTKNFDNDLAMELVGKEDDMILWDDFANSPEDLILDLGFLDVDSPDSNTTASTAEEAVVVVPPSDTGASLSLDQIEDFLFNDEVQDGYGSAPAAADDFLLDILLDSPLPSSTTTTYSDNDDINLSSSPDIASIQPHQIPPPLSEHPQSPQLEAPLKDFSSPPQEGSSQQASPSQQQEEENEEEEEQDDDDPMSKKRKRQIRNRDAAVRSRERKKMYVRDLELKSRFYESECRRLGMLLQCYLAENHALRLSLHSSNSSQAVGVSTTKQESAVLLLESLLLGSLLWFLGIISLLIVPQQLLSILEATLMEKGDDKNRVRSLALREAGRDTLETLVIHQSFMVSKRCRASRRKMRFAFAAAASVTCCVI